MTENNPFKIAQKLKQHDEIHGVRASERLITVAFAPEERFVEKIPQSVYDHIHSVIESTLWKTEYEAPGRNAENHSWTGGRSHSPVTPSHDQPANYELQYHLIKYNNIHD